MILTPSLSKHPSSAAQAKTPVWFAAALWSVVTQAIFPEQQGMKLTHPAPGRACGELCNPLQVIHQAERTILKAKAGRRQGGKAAFTSNVTDPAWRSPLDPIFSETPRGQLGVDVGGFTRKRGRRKLREQLVSSHWPCSSPLLGALPIGMAEGLVVGQMGLWALGT